MTTKRSMKSNLFTKRLAVLSMSAMMVTVLAACGGSTEAPTAEDAGKYEVNPGEPFSAYKDEISVTMGRVTTANPKLPAGDTYENNAYTRLVKDTFNAKITDQFEANGEDYSRQVSLAIASGELPDMMRVDSKDELKELVDNDLIEDLTAVYDQYATDEIKKIYDSYDGRALGNATIDGRLMGLPATSLDSAPTMVWVRQDWLDLLGIKLDADGDGAITLEEVEQTAQQFLKKDPGQSGNPVGIPFVNTMNTTDYNGSAYTMLGVASTQNAFPQYWMKGEDGKIFYGSTTEETKQMLGIMANWFKAGIIDPQFGTRTFDDITALYANGQSGIAFGPWHIPDWGLISVKQMDKNAKFSAYTLEDANGKVNVAHANPSNQFIVVRKGYEHPELAVKIVNLFYDKLANDKDVATTMPEAAKYQETGVDGSTRPFNIEVNSATSLLDDYSDVVRGIKGEISLEEVRTTESKNNIGSIKTYLSDMDTDNTTAWSKYHSRINGVGLIDKLTKEKKFVWMTPAFSGTTSSMKQTWANLSKLEQESFIKIITGSEPIDYFDTFVVNWRKQGGDQVIQEIESEITSQP
ncbi:hypothetical protein GCM10008014_16810 [Paenibacillus silvae]|uniref:EF-hand domain-containing protein n=1 Tax=Paenibacillus silvae TaxID=1325358 RepID=A0ABQ1Z8A8_9BACL|nr:extracellular solute-binding protein [Paenibacillus silvae]GGH51197.1 hypothetical protein GCM10008014_16810 [Paenibacillus silvae]